MITAPHPNESVEISFSEEKGRILRTKRSFVMGETVFLEHPIVRIVPEGTAPISTAIELQPIISEVRAFEKRSDAKRKLYLPEQECTKFPTLMAHTREHAIALRTDYNVCFTTLAAQFAKLPAHTQTALNNLYAPADAEVRAIAPVLGVQTLESLDTMLDLLNVEPRTQRLRARHACVAMSVNCFEAGGDALAVFPTICCASHSCAPNCVWQWSHTARAMILTAVRFIACGEEITISYLSDDDLLCPRAFRREALRVSYFFHCACGRCCAEGHELSPLSKTSSHDQVLDAVWKGACAFVGPPIACTQCDAALFDCPAPTTRFGAPPALPEPDAPRKASSFKLDEAPFEFACAACGKRINGKASDIARAALVALWLACLEEGDLFVALGRSCWTSEELDARLKRICATCKPGAVGESGFLENMFEILRATHLYNSGLDREGGLLLLSKTIARTRDIHLGQWADHWIDGPHYVPLADMLATLGFSYAADLVRRRVWRLAVETGVAAEPDLAWCHNEKQSSLPPIEAALLARREEDRTAAARATKAMADAIRSIESKYNPSMSLSDIVSSKELEGDQWSSSSSDEAAWGVQEAWGRAGEGFTPEERLILPPRPFSARVSGIAPFAQRLRTAGWFFDHL
eukprot:gnl/Chilomastix_cuspidata/2131.p1 GENE.gnl/Chilomastix_cuspidata/2131~~gnl/Chilomastix_cuspidata/2131.p1  ORF type:complete len:686 (+),score=89.63 gnl/Chilomastix_cuspidata/2131:156-2060(+)